MSFPTQPFLGPQLVDSNDPTGNNQPSRQLVYFHQDGSVEFCGVFVVEHAGQGCKICIGNANVTPAFEMTDAGQTVVLPTGNNRIVVQSL